MQGGPYVFIFLPRFADKSVSLDGTHLQKINWYGPIYQNINYSYYMIKSFMYSSALGIDDININFLLCKTNNPPLIAAIL